MDLVKHLLILKTGNPRREAHQCLHDRARSKRLLRARHSGVAADAFPFMSFISLRFWPLLFSVTKAISKTTCSGGYCDIHNRENSDDFNMRSMR